MQFFFVSFICLEFGIWAFSLLPNNGYTNQPTNQQMHKNMKMLNVLWSMHMCDCFIYAMIAFATYLLKVRADAIRLAGTKRTPYLYTAWLLIRFDFIYILKNNNNTNKSAKQKNKNNTFNQTGFTAHWSFIHACIIPTIELVESDICSREICWLRTRASRLNWRTTISENALFTVEHKFVDLCKSHSINGHHSTKTTTTEIPVNIKHTIKAM